MRIDPSRRGGINETRGKFREYRKKTQIFSILLSVFVYFDVFLIKNKSHEFR